MLPELAKAKIFSTFDLCHGYWHVSVDEGSSYLTTFNTPFGQYSWPFFVFVLFFKRFYYTPLLHMGGYFLAWGLAPGGLSF